MASSSDVGRNRKGCSNQSESGRKSSGNEKSRQGEDDQNGGHSIFPTDFSDWSEGGKAEAKAAHAKKRQRANTGSGSSQVSLDEFDKLGMNEKLSRMMRILIPLDGLDNSLLALSDDVQTTRAEVKNLASSVNEIEDRLRYVEYRAIDLESRSRRSNLIFHGITENAGEKCEDQVRDVIVNKLGIASGRNMYIQRIHRLGKVRIGRAARPRPIIAAFRDYGNVDLIMSEVGKLKGSGIGVSRDYPAEINEARNRLYPDFKKAKSDNKNAKLLFPAKLVIDGKTVSDEFPDWVQILNGRTHTGNSKPGTRSDSITPDSVMHGQDESAMSEANGAETG